MITFSKIDNRLTSHLNKAVMIFGASASGRKVKHYLDEYHINTIAFIDNDQNKVGNIIENIKVISFEECVEYYHNDSNLLIQIGSVYENEIITQLKNAHINCYISYTEFETRIDYLNGFLACQKEPMLKSIFLNRNQIMKYYDTIKTYKNNFLNTGIIRIMGAAPKVGNTSIKLSAYKQGYSILFAGHSYEVFDPSMRNVLSKYPVKLMVGVRDPISQNLSALFQYQHHFWDIKEYWTNGGDVENIFNNFIISNSCDNHYKLCEWENIRKELKTTFLVQNHFDEQFYPFWGIDIYQYPFDKEKGYSIYHFNDKLDVMIYQLEKLHDLEDEIGAFLLIDNFKLLNENNGNKKWYSAYYINAKNNLPISKKYFDECYNSKYIKHFYNEKDIDKFKGKWETHITS